MEQCLLCSSRSSCLFLLLRVRAHTHAHTHALGHYDIIQFLNHRTTYIPYQESLLSLSSSCSNKTHGDGRYSSNRNKNLTAHVTSIATLRSTPPITHTQPGLVMNRKLNKFLVSPEKKGGCYTHHIILLEEESPTCQWYNTHSNKREPEYDTSEL